MFAKINKIFSNNNIDLTEGNLLLKMIEYAVPLILAAIATLLFTSVDLLMVNYLGSGELAMSGIGACASTIGIVASAVNAFSVGASVIVGNMVGAKDKDGTHRGMSTALILAIGLGLVTAGILLLISPYLLQLSHISDSIYPYADTYIKIYQLAVPFIIIYSFASAIVRAFGDSKTPLYILLLSGLLNVLLNYLLVGPANLDVFGVGLATALSQMFACILIFVYLFKSKKCYTNLNIRMFKFYKKECLDLLRFGISSSIQSLIFALSNFVIQRVVNDFGENAIIANAAADNIGTYEYQIMTGFSVATMAMVSQNYGAKKYDNCKKVLYYGFLCSVVSSILVGGITLLLNKPILSLFIKDDNAYYKEIYDIAFLRLLILCTSYFTCGIRDCFSSYLRGIKYALTPTLISLLGSSLLKIIFFLTLYRLEVFHNLTCAYLTYPIFWILTDVMYLCVFNKLSNKAFVIRDGVK